MRKVLLHLESRRLSMFIAIFDLHRMSILNQGVGDRCVSVSKDSVVANIFCEKISLVKQKDEIVVNQLPLDIFCIDQSPFFSEDNMEQLILGGRQLGVCPKRFEL